MTTDGFCNDDALQGVDECLAKVELNGDANEDIKDQKASNREPDDYTELSFYKRLCRDHTFRRKFVIFICMCHSFLNLGLSVGLFGPTLLDLQNITGCSLDQVSMLFISQTIAYMLSSIAAGIVFDKFNKILQMFVPTFVLTGVVAAIPWCSIYEVMVTMHFCKGFCLGYIDTVGNAILLHIYVKEVKTYIQILHFTFAFGGIFSPIIAAPFLSQENTERQTGPVGNMTDRNQTNFTLNYLDLNFSNSNTSMILSENKSEVYKAYTIVAVISLSSAVSFLLLYLGSNETTCPTVGSESTEHQKEHIPLKLKLLVLFILAFFIIVYTAVEDTFAGFLTTFTVKQFHWTKSRGSFATAVFWTSYAVGRFSGIFVVNFFRQARLLRVYSLLLISAFVCLLSTTLTYKDGGVWVSSVVSGFAMSIFFPIFFSWTEEKFFHVDGKVTALILASASIGGIINPIILGEVMDTNPEWFAYIMLIQSCLAFILFSIAVCISGQMKKYRKSLSVEIKVDLDNSTSLLKKTEKDTEV